jgi:hypothetical protein
MHHLSTVVSSSMARSKGLVVIEGNVPGAGVLAGLLQQRICLWRRRIANGDNSPMRVFNWNGARNEFANGELNTLIRADMGS